MRCAGNEQRFAAFLCQAADIDRMETALAGLYQRHPVLRRYFSCSGNIGVQFEKQTIVPAIDRHDIGKLDAQARECELERIETSLISRIDPESPPLLRVAVAISHDERPVLLIAAHMLIVDGYAIKLFVSDLFKAYLKSDMPGMDPDLRYDEYTHLLRCPEEWTDP